VTTRAPSLQKLGDRSDGGFHGATLGDGAPHLPSYRGVPFGILALSSIPVRENDLAINYRMRHAALSIVEALPLQSGQQTFG
jgi:hypothetical protein